MKHLFWVLSILCLATSCQNKKYNPDTYAVETTADGGNELSTLRHDCLSFMNYCDQNYSSDLRLFVRDFLRTYNIKNGRQKGLRIIHMSFPVT